MAENLIINQGQPVVDPVTTFSPDALRDAFQKYRTELIIMPMYAMSRALQHMSIVQGIRYKEHVHEMKGKFQMGNFDKYKKGGFVQTAVDKRNAINHDHEVIAGLAEMERTLEPILGNVAYYDYCFSGQATKDGAKAVYKDYYASITPGGQVVSIDSNKKTLHKALGRVIPGYLELVKGDDEEAPEN